MDRTRDAMFFSLNFPSSVRFFSRNVIDCKVLLQVSGGNKNHARFLTERELRYVCIQLGFTAEMDAKTISGL